MLVVRLAIVALSAETAPFVDILPAESPFVISALLAETLPSVDMLPAESPFVISALSAETLPVTDAFSLTSNVEVVIVSDTVILLAVISLVFIVFCVNFVVSVSVSEG